MLEVLNQFYLQLSVRFQELLVFKRQTFTKMKQCLADMALASIVEDMERMTEQEAQVYRQSRQHLLTQASIIDINFNKFDIDELVEEQRLLLVNLQKRDERWFNHN